jgi:cation diffusion facilitator family transporter
VAHRPRQGVLIPARHQEVSRILLRVLLFNLAVAGAKLALGYATGAVSVVSDGYRSLADSASNISGLVGLRASRKPPDTDHPYGHPKFETLAAGGIFMFLVLAVLEIGRSALHRFGTTEPPEVKWLSFAIIHIEPPPARLVAGHWSPRRRARSDCTHARLLRAS